MRVFDSLTNFVTGMGFAEKDKAAADRFAFRPLNEIEIDAMADGDWVAKKIVEAPADDMFRAWRTWAAPPSLVTKFENAEKRHSVQAKLHEALTLARRYGGAALLIGADTETPDKPLRVESISRGGLKYLTVLTHRDIAPGEIDRDPVSPTFNQPAFYTLASAAGAGTRIHPSRLVFFVGAKRYDAMAHVTPFGYSVLQAPYDAIHHSALAAGAGASLLHEAKTDIVQIDNLGAQLSTDEGTAALTKRWSLASMLKSIHKTLLLDTGDKWQRSTTQFGGVEGMLKRYFQIAAGAADIPAARFLGQSASGLNSSGDADIRNYYDRLHSARVRDLEPRLERLDAVLWRDATGRAKPQSASFVWDPLWQPTEKEQADTVKVMIDSAKALAEAALIPEEALAKGVASWLVDRRTFPALEEALNEIETDDPASDDDPEAPSPSDRVAPRAPKRGRRRSRAGDPVESSREMGSSGA